MTAVGVTAAQPVGWEDELQVGLLGTTRRVWGRRGVKIRQRLQRDHVWLYLYLVVDPLRGRLWWGWRARLRAEDVGAVIREVQHETDVAALVWDRAPGHRAASVQALGLPLIEQPPYAPELNPAERVFELLRAAIEGSVYPDLGAKAAAVEAVLAVLDTDPARLQRLIGWQWLRDSLARLPAENAA